MGKDAAGAGGSRGAAQEALVLHFRATVAPDARGRFRAVTAEFPGVVAHGDSFEAAQAALEGALLQHLASTATVAVEGVYQDALEFIPYAAASLDDRLYVATNLDAVLATETGRKDGWQKLSVTQQQTEYFQVFEGTSSTEDVFEPGEYLTQIYALTASAAAGHHALYAGTNLKGLVYVREGEGWRPAFSTGEERVHALADFNNHLYAGTSAHGRLFRWDGRRADLVHQSPELGITALAAHGGAIYAGTYPEGLILRSEDGELWEIVCRTKQKFVNQFCSAPDALYAACSHPTGGAIFRSVDGQQWERCFHSPKDLNVYALALFGGRLFAGTGDEGRLYVSRNGTTWETALQSPEAALRVLAVHRGRLYLGTERRGVLYRTAGTEAPAPVIRDVAVSGLTSSRAYLEWSTDAPCDATVAYGVESVRDRTVANPSYSRRHRVELTGLSAGRHYTFLITARTAEGAAAHELSEVGFTTPVMTSPALSSTTHPEEERWYPGRDVRIGWDPMPGASRYVWRHAQQRITHLTLDDRQAKEPQALATVDADGVWWFAVAAVDEAGNVGDTSVRAVRVDTVAAVPTAASISHPDPGRWYNQPIVEVEADGRDGDSGVEGYLFAIGRVGEAWESLAFQPAPAPRWTLPRLPDGTWEIYVRLRDQAGNESAPSSLRVQIDTAPPTVTLDPPPAVTRVGELELKWQARDERSGIAKVYVQQRLESGDWETVYEGKGTTVKVEGADGARVWYRVLAEDRAGMRAAAETHQSVLFDGTPPLPITTLEATSLAGGDLLLRWAPTRDEYSEVARYHVYRATGESGPGPGTRVATLGSAILDYVDEGLGLAHGSHYTYRIASEDGVGNLQLECRPVAAICDKEAVAPVLRSPTHASEQWTTLTDAVIEWDPPADDTGVAEYVWRLDRNPASSLVKGVDAGLAGPPLKISHLLDGLWYAHVCAVDGAGNVSPAAHYPLRVVTRPPHARLKPLPHLNGGRTVRLEWEAEDGVVAVSVGVREGGAQQWRVVADRAPGHATEVEVDREGVFEFSIRATDGHGRQGLWEEGQVTLVDATPPMEVPVLEAASRPHGAVHLEWEPSWDELAGLASYRVFRSRAGESRRELIAEVPGSEECAWLDPLEGVADGTKVQYTVWPVDAAGNVLEQGPTAEAVCDRGAPAPKLVARTHPDAGKAYAARRLEVLWDAPADATGVQGVIVELDASPQTVPNPDTLPVRDQRTLTFDLKEDGRWYLHACAIDGAGNASEPVHLAVTVDTKVDPPIATFLKDPFSEWQAGGEVTVQMTPPEDMSGIPAYWWVMDQSPNTVVDRLVGTRHASRSVKLRPKSEGVWHIHLAAEDGAGNLSEPVHLSMRLTTGLPMPHVTKSTHPEGLWSTRRDVELGWEKVEGDRIEYLYWIAAVRAEEPPASTMRLADSSLRVTMEEGIRYLHLCAIDERGRRSSVVAYQLRVDATAPEISVHSPSHPKGRWAGKRRVQYAVEAEDAQSGIARVELALTPYRQEPDVWELALGTEGEREVPGDGLWTLWARAVDLAGNMSPLASWDIQVDLTAAAPGIASPTHPEGQWAPGLKAEVWLQPGEDLSGVAEYFVHIAPPGEEIPAEPPADAVRSVEEVVKLTLPGDGRWTVAAWSRDVAGNLSQHSRAVLAADSAAAVPAGFVVEPSGEGGWIRSGAIRVYWRAPEETSGEPIGYVWSLDREAATMPEQGALFTAMPELDLGEIEDGVWWLHVRTLDGAGNLSAEAAHVRLAIDGKAPTLALAPPKTGRLGWVTTRHLAIVTKAQDPVSGVVGCFWTLHQEGDEAPEITEGRWKEEPEWTVEIPSDGTWVLAVAALDGAGNLSEPQQQVLKVDAEALPPRNVRIPSHPDPEAWSGERELTVEWEEPADASGRKAIRCRLAADAAKLGEPAKWEVLETPSPSAIPIPGDGRWTVGLVLEDKAGNVSEPALLTFMVDSQCPTPKVTSPTHPRPEVWYAETTVELEVAAHDEASGLAQVLVGATRGGLPDPQAMTVVEGGRTTLALDKGKWELYVIARDQAGNRSTPAMLAVQIDPAVRPPLVTSASHPNPEVWVANSEVRYSIVPSGGSAAAEFWVAFDQKPDTQPDKRTSTPVGAGAHRISANHSGEWWLHVVAATKEAGLATQATHLPVRIDVSAPPAPEPRSISHPPSPRRSKERSPVFEWTEPRDVSGIEAYHWTISRPALLGMKKELKGTTNTRYLKLPDLEPGMWEFAVAATDKAGLTGAPGRASIAIADVQDLAVVVHSESWRVAQAGVELEIRQGEKSLKHAKSGASGDAWFKELPYGEYVVSLHLRRPNPPVEFEGVTLEEGESHMQFEVSLAGCAWMICRDELRLWVPQMWLDGGRIEILPEKGHAAGVHMLKDLPSRGFYLVAPLPAGLMAGSFQFMGGPLNKLQWPPLPFHRQPLK